MKSAVITFPGSNCDRDMAVAITKISGNTPLAVWHGDSELPAGLDFIAVPGGFSYGDYLRCGAIAARSPIMQAIVKAAERGVAILGVCNGFQILTESQLLPGALMRNSGISFVCREVPLIVEETDSRFTHAYNSGERIILPVAHHDGNYFAQDKVLDELEAEGRVAFRYAENVNGSSRNIAGITNSQGNVLGMMPHPERHIEKLQGGTDGAKLFESVTRSLLEAV